MAEVTVPGKVILVGEHAVVYGEPAIAAAIDLRTRITARRAADRPTVNGQPLSEHHHAHAAEALRLLWPAEERPVAIGIESGIPSAAGLGSSAALSAGCAATLLALRDEGGEERVARAAYDVEWKVQGGRGSPTDTTTVTHGAGVLVDSAPGPDLLWEVRRGERAWFLHHLEVPDLRLVVGNTGVRGRTADQVAKVARFVARTGFARDVIREIGGLTREALLALRAKDPERLGRLMDRNQSLLAILGVSTPELDRLVRVARATSYGAKLTGSGGGGSMIALTDRPEATAEAIRKAGGTPYVVKLGGVGLRGEGSA